MLLTFFTFLHLIATCAAIGTIVVTDLRLLAKLMGYRVVIPRPQRFETVIVSASLLLLYVTGAVLVGLHLSDTPNYLANGKLLGKLLLVGLLSLNAFVLHFLAFPILSLSRSVSRWTRKQWLTVSGSVSLSNSLWFFCAFLGVARVWNFSVSMVFVLGVALIVWALTFVLVNIALAVGSRDAPKPQPDWVDSTIATLGELTRLTDRPTAVKSDRTSSSANQQHFGRRIADRRLNESTDRRRRDL